MNPNIVPIGGLPEVGKLSRDPLTLTNAATAYDDLAADRDGWVAVARQLADALNVAIYRLVNVTEGYSTTTDVLRDLRVLRAAAAAFRALDQADQEARDAT